MIGTEDWRTIVAHGQRRDADGTLLIGGVRADALARAYGTPLVALDRTTLDAAIAAYASAGAAANVEVAYAGKALLFVGLARHLASTPLALDVCSLGELCVAERGGFPAARMHLHGCGKTDEELEAALDGRVGAVVVDNLLELERLVALANGRTVPVVLRVNVGIEAHTHDYVRTAGENTKFGLGSSEFDQAVSLLRGDRSFPLLGVHSHIGSQIFEHAPLLENVDATIGYVARAAQGGLRPALAIFGGGIGVDERGGEGLDPGALFAAMRPRADAAAKEYGLAPLRLGVEPGRALVARAGTSIYRVVAIKQFGKRRFAIVDGGMADNPRPALYGAFHQPLVAASRARAEMVATTICGRSCENDEMVETHLPADLAGGDLLVLTTTGAYTFSMASNYNRFPRPAVVWVGAGQHETAVRRDSLDDLLRNDL